MPAAGRLVTRADRNFFVLEGSDLELTSGSISSEWTTESESEEPPERRLGVPQPVAPPKVAGQTLEETSAPRKRRVRNWRLRYRVPGDGTAKKRACYKVHASSSSSSGSSSGGSSSSSTSTGSSSSSGGETARQKRQRRQILHDWSQANSRGGAEITEETPSQCEADDGVKVCQPGDAEDSATLPQLDSLAVLAHNCVQKGRPASMRLRWFPAKKSYRSFALAPRWLSSDDICAIHSAAKHGSVREIHDRKGYLAFKHTVWRFEMQLRAMHPGLYVRLMDLMRHADEARWRRLRKKSAKVYPEIEYIEYDVQRMGEPCYIEPHVDNKSAVTLVAMLSDPQDYVGGRSRFRRAEGRQGCREVQLHKGDIVLFRGEKLLHWITPVTSGVRIILQIELSRV